jgi:hypothetical protein
MDYFWYGVNLMAGILQGFLASIGGGVVTGQQAYTTAGTYTFTVPAGVTSVSTVCVGGGGGGAIGDGSNYGSGGSGAGLAYGNNISVTPGESLTVIVGAGGGQSSGCGGSGGILAGNVTFTSASTYQIVVGAFTSGASGQSSRFGNVLVADGGGLGGASGSAGGAGGSGGGGGTDDDPIYVYCAGGAATQTNAKSGWPGRSATG